MSKYSKDYYKIQKARRLDQTIQKFREFDVLTEPELEKLRTKEQWLSEYLKHHTYISVSNLSGDFMLTEWEINLIGKCHTNALEIRRLLSYGFRPIIQRLAKEGKIVKINSRTYKVVKN